MKKFLMFCLFVLILNPGCVFASVIDGVCFNSYGFGLRGGKYSTPRCIISRNGSECMSCGENSSDYTGCDGGCNGEGVGVAGHYFPNQSTSGFKCTSAGIWVPTTDDCTAAVEPTPIDAPCGQGQYKFKYNDLDTQWYCADCPTPGLRRADGGDIRECIQSDNVGTTGIISCQISSLLCPSEFEDSTGRFWFWNGDMPTICPYSN